MLISFNLNSNIYDTLKEKILQSEECSQIIYSFVPIIYRNNNYILTIYHNLEGLFLDNKQINISIYNNKSWVEHIIMNPISVHDNNFDIEQDYDCFYDDHTNLLLIKYSDILLTYFKIDSKYDINFININNNKTIKISYLTEEYSKLDLLYKLTNVQYHWDDRFLLLPPRPFIIIKNDGEKDPITGSLVTLKNKLFGIVSYIDNNIKIIPLITIIRCLKYLDNYKLLSLLIDVKSQIININGQSINCVSIQNNFYNRIIYKNNIMIKKLNKSEIKSDNLIKIRNLESYNNNYKILIKNSVICEIDDYKFDNNENLIIGDNKIPFTSYIWLFKDLFHNESLSLKMIIKKKIITNIFQLENLQNNFSINISNFKYLKLENFLIFELNEVFLNIFRQLFINNFNLCDHIDKYKYSFNSKIVLCFNTSDSEIYTVQLLDNFNDIELFKKHKVKNLKKVKCSMLTL